jgi:hypothetical protein
MIPSSVSKKSAARIFHGRKTGFATNPSEKQLEKPGFG